MTRLAAIGRTSTGVIGAMTPILETPHLRLREFRQDDLDNLAAMVADEDQMRFYPRPKTRDEASAWISRNLALYKEYGFGFWFIESLPTSGFLGYCGIRPLTLEGALEMEIGWHTKKTFWKQGIATELRRRLGTWRSDALRCCGW